MDADFCKYMMGTARFQALAEALTKLYAARDLVGASIVQDMLHAENVRSNESAAPQAHQHGSAHPDRAPAVRCGLDDTTWADEKRKEFDKHEESRDYGTQDQGENG